MLRFFPLIAAMFTAPSFAQSTYPQPPIEAYGQLPWAQEAEISPDGTKVALLVNDQTGAALIVTDLDGEVLNIASTANTRTNGIAFYDNQHVVLRTYRTRQ